MGTRTFFHFKPLAFRSPDSGCDKRGHPELCVLVEASRHAISKPSITSRKRFASPFSRFSLWQIGYSFQVANPTAIAEYQLLPRVMTEDQK